MLVVQHAKLGLVVEDAVNSYQARFNLGILDQGSLNFSKLWTTKHENNNICLPTLSSVNFIDFFFPLANYSS